MVRKKVKGFLILAGFVLGTMGTGALVSQSYAVKVQALDTRELGLEQKDINIFKEQKEEHDDSNKQSATEVETVKKVLESSEVSNTIKDATTIKTVTETEAVAFQVIKKEDNTLEKGNTKVMQKGKNGVKEITSQETSTPSTSATDVLSQSGLFQKNGNTFFVSNDWGNVLEVTVDGEKISIYFDGLYYSVINYASKEQYINEYGLSGEELYQEIEKERNHIYKAVQVAAKAVYGSSSQANQLASQILASTEYNRSF